MCCAGDLEDISAIAALMRDKCPTARLTVCGMSTGVCAFAGFDLRFILFISAFILTALF